MEVWTIIDNNNLSLLQQNSLVRGTTMTHSQKWLLRPGYEECNRVIYGLVTTTDIKDIYDIEVKVCNINYYSDADNIPNYCRIVTDVGSSGWSTVELFVGSEEEKNRVIQQL